VKLIVGLGNPGPRYERTRHNAGFMAVDRLVARHARSEAPRGKFDATVVEGRVEGRVAGRSGGTSGEPIRCAFLKPNTFMNLSGRSVIAALNFYKADPATDLLVITDDVALPLGKLRIKGSGGAGGHNGLSDIARALSSEVYPRLRIGIDATPPMMNQADWVLSRFTDQDMATLDPALDRAADAVDVFLREGLDAAMNKANADPDAPPRPKKPRPPDAPAGARHSGNPPDIPGPDLQDSGSRTQDSTNPNR